MYALDQSFSNMTCYYFIIIIIFFYISIICVSNQSKLLCYVYLLVLSSVLLIMNDSLKPINSYWGLLSILFSLPLSFICSQGESERCQVFIPSHGCALWSSAWRTWAQCLQAASFRRGWWRNAMIFWRRWWAANQSDAHRVEEENKIPRTEHTFCFVLGRQISSALSWRHSSCPVSRGRVPVQHVPTGENKLHLICVVL